MTQSLSDLSDQLLQAARRAGADAADAIAVDGTSLSITVRAGALEQAERSEGIEVGLRVLVGQRQACVSASDTKPETLSQMAERAVAMAREAPEDPHAGLADPAQLATDTATEALELYDPSPEPDPAALQDDAARAEAAARAVERVGARKPKTGAFPVIFDERIASALIGHLLQAVNGSMIARGSSWLRDAVGEAVLPDSLSIIEDPHRRRVAGSRLFDAEGLPTAKRAIVDKGVLTGWTLDLATGSKLGLPSTANASRGTSAPPSPSPTNIALTQSDQSRADLIAEMGTGLLITSMIGSTINPNTGDYSRGASGFWVENGEVTYPANECTVAGNLRDMLKTIRPANDARPYLSRMVPSLLVEGLTLAGD